MGSRELLRLILFDDDPADPSERQNLDTLRSEQVAAVYHNAAPGTFGSMFAGIILSGMLFFVGAVPLWAMITFSVLVSSSAIGRLLLLRAYGKSERPPSDWRRWALAAIASAFAGGVCWGLSTVLLMDPLRVELQFIVILTCAGMAAGAITAFGTYLPAYYFNFFPMMVPTVIWSAYQNDPLHWTYAVLCLLWIVIMAMLARTFSRILVRSLRLQFENLALANDLRLQKEFAEEANTAKSRFLAAASHDLRQPVHALEMFVGALGNLPMSAESRRLVGQIEGSVESLDSLFNSILDVSRLDAGIVDVRQRAFAVQPMLERICSDQRPEAEEKGLALRLVPCRAVVRTDPVLLERILRNLVSNAVRYTEAGRILVGCRRSDRLSVEVWDSGPGISDEQQSLVFQEFYQVGNPERSRTRGLGLGLAIVRRLSNILEIPLTLRSQPGKGSVFKVSVALAPDHEMAQPVFEEAIPAARYQDQLSILVIDDDPEIQAAMRALLSDWGHSITVAGSGDEMIARLAEMPVRPDLIISDYRLRGGENGIDTIRRIRSQFSADTPALLITGDTAPDRLREAAASGCFLMHKPVSNARLRAAITNLTRAESRPLS
jgi:signal transduction histidine kinase/CheY-like chemotaxis protein